LLFLFPCENTADFHLIHKLFKPLENNPIPFLASLEAYKPFDTSQVLAMQSKLHLATCS